jgi:hypothetical protein
MLCEVKQRRQSDVKLSKFQRLAGYFFPHTYREVVELNPVK